MRRSFSLESALPTESLLLAISREVGPRPSIRDLRAGRAPHKYRGQFSHQGFRLIRNTRARNSFPPSINGLFKPGFETTTIDVEINGTGTGLFAIFFSSLFIFAGIFFGVVFYAAGFLKLEPGLIALPVGLVATALISAVAIMYGFGRQTKRAERELVEIFTAQN